MILSKSGVIISMSVEEERRTYWFIKLVFPTPLSPSIITYSRISQYVDVMDDDFPNLQQDFLP